SIIYPPSHCDACGRRLRPLELVPVLGYFLYRGRCRQCGAPLFRWYPLLELLTAGLYLLLWHRFGPGWVLLKYMLLLSLMVVIAGIDLQTYLIPDGLVLLGLLLGAVFLPFADIAWQMAISGALVGGGLLLLLAAVSRGGMGGGDVKLGFILGLCLGWQQVLIVLLVAVVTGALAGLALMALGRKGRRDALPFAPCLAVGLVLALLRGPELAGWYLTKFMGL
ncbi:MAG: prepilin peptidase, partial [Clostridia bacterium]|nr:prepilin peptidase [Clostridia bacterium]